MKKLAIITSHPIQYYAPIFQLLTQRNKLSVMVFYTLGNNTAGTGYDPGFNKNISWDISLLDGYDKTWVTNTARQIGSHHFSGIKNPTLIKQVTSWNPDTLLVFGWSYQSHLQLIRHFKNRVPILFRGDSTLLDERGGFKSVLKLAFLKWVYSHVDVAFYTGQNNKAYFKRYGLRNSQLIFAPHAIDNERFRAALADSAIRKNLNIPDNAIIILFAGKFITKKAPLHLLNAFLRLTAPNAHLLFVGNGALERQLKLAAEGQRNIHFWDFKNQSIMPGIYKACDIFCLPSTGPGESWGLAVNEAMACGKAVIVSDKVGCAADLVKDDLNGFVFKAGDISRLAAKLNYLMQNPHLVNVFGIQSAQLINPWNFNTIAKVIEDTVTGKTNGRSK